MSVRARGVPARDIVQRVETHEDKGPNGNGQGGVGGRHLLPSSLTLSNPPPRRMKPGCSAVRTNAGPTRCKGQHQQGMRTHTTVGGTEHCNRRWLVDWAEGLPNHHHHRNNSDRNAEYKGYNSSRKGNNNNNHNHNHNHRNGNGNSNEGKERRTITPTHPPPACA
jgi:hypothetical protein